MRITVPRSVVATWLQVLGRVRVKGRRSAGGSRGYACAHRPLPLTPGNHPGPRRGRAVCGHTSLRAPLLCSHSVSCMFSTRRASEQVLPGTRVARASHLAQTWPSAPAAQQALPTRPDPARTEQPSLPPCSVPAPCTPPPAPRGPRGPRAPPRSARAAAHTPMAPGRGVGAERGAGSHSAALEAAETPRGIETRSLGYNLVALERRARSAR